MIAFIQAHADELIAIITGIVTVASLIANLTPGETDNKVVEKISKLVNVLALNLKKK